MATVIRGSDNFDTADNATQTELDAKATLSHNGSTKLATTSTGIDVTGTVTADGLTVDGIQTADASLLAAISDSSTITGTAVDYFIYRAEDDTDPTWRDRCSHTSWYNETLNTATRGSRREFPAVAMLVAESDTVTIYDLDSGTPEMWMVFDGAGNLNNYIMEDNITSAAFLNGTLVIGANTTGALTIIGFISDRVVTIINSATSNYGANTQIVNRNSSSIGSSNDNPYGPLVDRNINDVAITVLPNAPIDAATGMAVPTIAVATDGGLSVITDSGAVYDISGFSPTSDVAFVGNRVLQATTAVGAEYVEIGPVPSADISSASWADWELNSTTTIPRILCGDLSNVIDVDGTIAIGGADNLTLLHENTTTPAEGSVAYITSKYNTGYMTGDIKAAFCVDTDVTSLSGSELVTNGDMGSPTGWTITSDWAVNTVTAGKATASGTNTAGTANGIKQNITCVVGEAYVVSVTCDSRDKQWYFGITGVGHSGALNTTGNFSVTFIATSTSHELFLAGYDTNITGQWDNVTCRLAVPDRSVNGNAIGVHGTLTVTNQDGTAAADNDELKVLSGFSTSNYLEQPYNSDLDFGTGDFSIEVWAKSSSNTTVEHFVARDSTTSASRFTLFINADGTVSWAVDDNTTDRRANSSTVVDDGVWRHFVGVYDGSGGVLLYINGELDTITTGSALLTMNNSSAVLRVGVYPTGNPATTSTITPPRITATALSAEEVKRHYNAERPMFYADAKVVFEGTTDAVADLAHDPVTNELHVATSTDRSTFQGLVRTDESTNNVTLVDANDGLIVEKY